MNKKQFDNFYVKNRQLIINMINKRIGCNAYSFTYEDLHNDLYILLHAHNEKHQHKTEEDFQKMLSISVKNMFLDKRRISTRLQDDTDVSLDRMPDNRCSSYKNLMLKREWSQIMNNISNLKPQFKEPLMLYYLENLHYKEIAEVLGVKINTVKSRMNRARKTLKEKRHETMLA